MRDNNRTVLYQQVPLEMPYLIQIFPCYACNFHCQYCIHALPEAQRGVISDKRFMDMSVYRRLIDDLFTHGKTVKMLRFAGIGEPLLHPQIAEMVEYARQKQVAQNIDIVTNGSLLTKELSDQLLDAGLTTLRVSVEGLSAEEYLQNAGAHIDWEKFIAQLEYFYCHCKTTKVYVKIIDYMLKGDAEREKLFYRIFAPISHMTAVEHLTPTIQEIDYNEFCGEMGFSLTQDGEKKQNIQICPQPFYMIQYNPNGSFTPCCSMKLPLVLSGENTTLSEVWNGEDLTRFRLSFLQNKRESVCRQCTLYQYGTYEEDILDGHEKELIIKIKGKGGKEK